MSVTPIWSRVRGIYIGKYPLPLLGGSADATWGEKYEKLEEKKEDSVKEKGEKQKKRGNLIKKIKKIKIILKGQKKS